MQICLYDEKHTQHPPPATDGILFDKGQICKKSHHKHDQECSFPCSHIFFFRFLGMRSMTVCVMATAPDIQGRIGSK